MVYPQHRSHGGHIIYPQNRSHGGTPTSHRRKVKKRPKIKASRLPSLMRPESGRPKMGPTAGIPYTHRIGHTAGTSYTHSLGHTAGIL